MNNRTYIIGYTAAGYSNVFKRSLIAYKQRFRAWRSCCCCILLQAISQKRWWLVYANCSTNSIQEIPRKAKAKAFWEMILCILYKRERLIIISFSLHFTIHGRQQTSDGAPIYIQYVIYLYALHYEDSSQRKKKLTVITELSRKKREFTIVS